MKKAIVGVEQFEEEILEGERAYAADAKHPFENNRLFHTLYHFE
jgi:hypothetical protein